MASSSSSSSPQIKYDVFLSFRGEDTRHNFTSHLHAALLRKKIVPFIDCQLEKGDEISPSLLNAIEASKIAVIVFSEGYAFSSWCLDELTKIIECKKRYGQIVIPIFYNVDPSSVRNQTGILGDAFMKLQQRCKQRLEVEKLQIWRSALKDAADISGSHCYGIRPESELIEEIANDILNRLNDSCESDDAYLVGAGSCITEIESLLRIESTDVCSLGIWGIGGIGKTSIAEAIFNKISNHFESSYFLEDVRAAERNGGLQKVQQKLFSNMLEDRNIKTGFRNLNFQIKRLNRKKVLIVFDNVTSLRQIEFLIKHHDCLAPGSRIIVTTRDKQVLENCCVNTIYEMKELPYTDALKLFSRHAFKQYLPNESYMELSKKAIKYAHGVPLALKVLGCSLYTRSTEEWKCALKKLKSIPNMEIQDVLKISYDDLDDNEKDIFLDIVCFFIGGNRDLILEYLNASGFFGEIGIRTLLDKCLITMSHNIILVHELLQKMGKEIIRQECVKDPGKRSRLYQPEDIYEVLTENRGTKAIEGISLNMCEVQEIQLHPHAFTNMPNLRCLRFYGINKFNVSCFEGHGFRKVRYFEWHSYPLKSLPLGINAEYIVSLIMPKSNVEQLWDGDQNLVHLKEIDLYASRELKNLPHLSRVTKLETLNLGWCLNLIEPPVISSCNIRFLKLKKCGRLKSLPSNLCELKSLHYLNLSGCSNIQTLPDELGNLESLEELNVGETAIAGLPSSIGCLSRLYKLHLENCKAIANLPNSLCKLKSLQDLDVSGCSSLQRLPNEFGNLESLKRLSANRTAIREIPSFIVRLNKLEELSFIICKGDEKMSSLSPIFSLPLDRFCSLRFLNLGNNNITMLPESLGQLSSLDRLYLDNNNFVRIPPSIIHLSNLTTLSICDCKRLICLPELPCQISLMTACGCKSLVALSSLPIFSPGWKEFEFSNCSKLESEGISQIVKDGARIYRKHMDNIGLSTNICFPGSKIPECFCYKGWGSCITLQPPPVWWRNKFLCIGFCAIASCQDLDEFSWHLKVRCEGKHKTYFDRFIARIKSYEVQLDHVFLRFCFDKYWSSESCYENEVVFQFYLQSIRSKRREYGAVKKCGIDFFFAEEEEEKEEETHPKRQRILF